MPPALPPARPAASAAPSPADELADLRARLAAAERRADEATAALRRSEAARVAWPAAGGDGEGAHPAGAHPRALVEQLPAIVYTASVAPGHPTLFVTAQVERLLGIRADEWLANPRLWIERVHDHDRARVEREWGEAHAAGRRFSAEYRMTARDGRVRWFRDEAELLRDAGGAPLCIQGVMLDITERRQAEDELRRTEERWRAMIENAHDLTTILDADGVTVYESPSVERVLGFRPDELVGLSAFVHMHPDDVPAVTAELTRVMAEPGAVGHAEYRHRHKDGTWRHLEAFGRTLSPTSAADGVVANIRDVTERKRAEEALRTAQERWRAMIDNAHDIVTILDREGRMGYQSPALTRVLGYTPEELAGQSAFAYMHPDDAGAVAEQLGQVLASPGAVGHAEYRFRHKDGTWRHLEAFGRTLSPASAADGVVANVRDISERKAAERALQESEEHFRRLIERGNDLLMISAPPDFGLTYVSPSVEHLLGYTPEEMRGFTPADVLHPEDLPRVQAGMAEIFAVPGTVRRIEWRVRHKDGSWRHYDAIGRTLDPHSGASGAVCNCRDVTEQRQAELALQRSEQHFRAVIENASDLILISTPDGTLTYASPSVERVLGWTPAEFTAAAPEALVHPDDLAHVLESMQGAVRAPGAIRRVDFRVRHRDGGWRRFQSLARALSPDAPAAGIVCNARDVTEQRAAEEALQRSEEHFRRLIENASDLVMVARADGPLTYASPSVERLLGYRPDEMVGRMPHEIIHPDDVGAVWAALARIAAEPGTVHAFGARLRHRDGSWRTVEALGRTVAPHTADEGIVANSRDVTARLEAEAALRQATAEAEQAREEAERANRAKSEFLSRTSHELRTPLNSIIGFAQVLEDVELPPEYRAGVRHILGAGRHLLGLINDVLDIARIEAGEGALSLEAVGVRAAVREAADMVRPLAAARGVRVVDATPAADAPAYARADRQRLVQVLLNLLSNAVKYNRAGGVVRVHADARAGDAGRVRIRVGDEGAGLTPEQQAQLFVPFARLGAERTGVEGTGLGLALSQRLAHAMGGALTLERTGPGGSEFCVELAAAPDPLAGAPAAAAPGDAAGAPPRTPATLLYVEDNLANLALVETVLLPRPEWRVMPAMQGRLGVALAAEHRPDVVLLDLHLPDLHGAEVLRLLRADPQTAGIPVVVITADATPRAAEAMAAAGADAFLTKPLDVRRFVQTVERLLAAPRPAA